MQALRTLFIKKHLPYRNIREMIYQETVLQIKKHTPVAVFRRFILPFFKKKNQAKKRRNFPPFFLFYYGFLTIFPPAITQRGVS